MKSEDHIIRRRLGPAADPVGLVMVDTVHNPVFVNSIAREVISYAIGHKRVSKAQLREVLQSNVLQFLNSRPEPARIMKSGRRKYACRTLLLETTPSQKGQAYCAVIFERISRRDEPLRRMVEQYGLTARESEITALLIQGLTSKEIAERLKISPHTVKGYIEFVMTKMGVNTRSGIVGRLSTPRQKTPDSDPS